MSIDAARIRKMFETIAGAMDADKERLCALDGVIGDADHGIAMALGFGAVRKAINAADPHPADPTAMFYLAAKSFLNAVGASSGPLYATAFMRAGAAAKGKASLDAAGVAEMIGAMSNGIQDRGKAEPGEKTMVDAWAPAAEAASRASGGSVSAILDAAVNAAEQGAEATVGMVAGKGRSSRLGERAVGHMDPGAASAVTILKAMRDALAG